MRVPQESLSLHKRRFRSDQRDSEDCDRIVVAAYLGGHICTCKLIHASHGHMSGCKQMLGICIKRKRAPALEHLSFQSSVVIMLQHVYTHA